MDTPIYKMSPLFRACASKRDERGKQYNVAGANKIVVADYHPFGHASYAQMVWIKSLRLRVETERAAFNPDPALIEEHIVDLTNYLSFWYEWMTGKEMKS